MQLHEHSRRGTVSLIGCGPGDAELLTIKAMRRIMSAEVLVVDRLVGPDILAAASPGARVIDVGKEAGGPSMPQEEINRILVREALLGHAVARLKGGDSFIFGRAAEEMAAVRAAGIEVEVIPGITAAHACAASVGLPLTLRSSVRQFSVLTGATADGALDVDWVALARPGQAFAIYMGVRSAREIRDALVAAGANRELEIVIVENGTLPNERVVATRLDDLADAVAGKGIKGPAIIFAGLSWEAANLSPPDKVEVYSRDGADAPRNPLARHEDVSHSRRPA